MWTLIILVLSAPPDVRGEVYEHKTRASCETMGREIVEVLRLCAPDIKVSYRCTKSAEA